MRHTLTVGILAALVLTAACTNSSDDSSAPASRATPNSAKLSTEWISKLEEATNAESAICNQVGDQACAEHLTDIALVVGDLQSAIEEASAEESYQRSMKEIEKVNAAVDAYTEHECLGDPNAGIEGSPCPDDAYTIMSGGAALQLTLETDELKAG